MPNPSQIDQVSQAIGKLTAQQEHIQDSLEKINDSISTIHTKSIEHRDSVREKLNSIETKVDKIRGLEDRVILLEKNKTQNDIGMAKATGFFFGLAVVVSFMSEGVKGLFNIAKKLM